MHTLGSKLVRLYKVTPVQAETLVKEGLGYPHLIKKAKKDDVVKLIGQSAADKVKPPVKKEK